MPRFILSLISIIILVNSCATNSLKKIIDNPDCETSIVGNYFSERIYTGQVPVFFKKRYDGTSFKVYGELINTTKNGFHFIPQGKGLSSSRDTTFYSYDQVDALINARNHILYGEVPDKYLDVCTLTITMINFNDGEPELKSMKIHPGERFGFCIDPGIYQIVSILFTNEHSFIDESILIDTLRINVEKGFTNYIGDLYLDNEQIEGEKFIIPYRNKHNPVASSGGAVFGVAGAIVTSLSADYTSLKSFHTITLKEDKQVLETVRRKSKSNLLYQIKH